jgi:glycosyltransferase involved in cell wall biosynthesis
VKLPGRVAIVSPNTSSNCMGRALLLAELLRGETDVRIIGIQRGASAWSPGDSSTVPVESLPLSEADRYSRAAVGWLRDAVGDDFAIISKPLPHSLGLALLAGLVRRGRVLLDVDDWESGMCQLGATRHGSSVRYGFDRLHSLVRRAGLNIFAMTCLLEQASRFIPHIVSNRWLQRRFGGPILYHVRSPETLDPAASPPSGVTLDGSRVWVGFCGTPRPHKGVSALVDALASLPAATGPGLILMGVGEANNAEVAAAREKLGSRLQTFPQFPLAELPSYLAMTDIIAIPSLDVPAARGQIPAKLFDAMAMARPVVASAINDIPEIAADAGVVVKPGAVGELADAIRFLASDANERARLGRNGRSKFLASFTHDAGRQVLRAALNEASAG